MSTKVHRRRCKKCGVWLPAGQRLRLCHEHRFDMCHEDSCREELTGLRLLCDVHREKRRKKNRRHAKDNPGYNWEYKKRRAAEEGLCNRCLAPLNPDCDSGKKQCINCREMANPYKMEVA